MHKRATRTYRKKNQDSNPPKNKKDNLTKNIEEKNPKSKKYIEIVKPKKKNI